MQNQNWMLTNGGAARTTFGRRWRFNLVEGAVRLFDWLLTWQTRATERAQLASLDDRLLRDIGLARADVERERSKPFWTA